MYPSNSPISFPTHFGPPMLRPKMREIGKDHYNIAKSARNEKLVALKLFYALE